MKLTPRERLIVAYETTANNAERESDEGTSWRVRHEDLEALRDAIEAMPSDLDRE